MDDPVVRSVPPQGGPSRRRYWVAGAIAAVGVAGGLVLGIDSYRHAQRDLDDFARVDIPGAMTVHVEQPSGRVVYYEGDDGIGFEELDIAVTGPSDAPAVVEPYEGEMVYETADLVQGRAVATFDAEVAGDYDVSVSGVEDGVLAVGRSFSRRVLPGIAMALAFVGLGAALALLLWLVTLVERSDRRP